MISSVMDLLKIIAIVGPTASGKSVCGVKIARAFNGEVICVDSRTVYKGMDIGTAKVRNSEPKHWGVDLASPDEEYTVAMFQEYAQKKIEEIAKRGKLPVLVGGTGLWMDAVVDNLSFPNVPPDDRIRSELEAREVDDLAREYLKRDPEGADFVDIKNKRRLIRALEVCRVTGKTFSELRQKGHALYDALWIGMSGKAGSGSAGDVSREELDKRIDNRVDEMIADGLVEEVRRLKDLYGCDIPSMSGIGYRELCTFFDKISNDVTESSIITGVYSNVVTGMGMCEVIEMIKTNTRRFARRQRRWFKRREEIVWVKDCGEAMAAVRLFLSS